MTAIHFSYQQLRALKDVLAHRSPVDWQSYEDAKELIRTAPLDLPEDVEVPKENAG